MTKTFIEEQAEMFDRIGIKYEVGEKGLVFPWQKEKPEVEMTDLELLMRTYDRLTIPYTIREQKVGKRVYQYMFLGDKVGVYGLEGTFETIDVETLCNRCKFLEFMNGELMAY